MIIFYCCPLLINYLFNMFLFCLLIGFSFSLHVPQNLVILKDTVLTDVDFYEKISKDEWDSFSLDKKNSVFNDFLKNELGYYDGINQGVHLYPKTLTSLAIRKKQVLLNNVYEHVIARPLLKPLEVEKNIQNLQKKVEAYHLLIGYSGSQQDTESKLSKRAAKTLIDSLYLVIQKKVGLKNIEEVFMDFSLTYSIDPSVKQNKGFLGWIPWGRTVSSFQEPLFSSLIGVLPPPIHTEYGYHLILKRAEGLSSHFYYSEDFYKDLAIKVSEGSLEFDSLRTLSTSFDSLAIKKTGLIFGEKNIDFVVGFILKKQQTERLVGNKNQLIDWLQAIKENPVLFVANNKGFGIGWLISNLKETPSSRITSIKTKKQLKDLIVLFVLQEEVLKIGLVKQIDKEVSFKKDWLNNKKSIVFNDYLSFLLNNVSLIDSGVVFKEYKKQSLENKLFRPQRVVFSEIRVFELLVAQQIVGRLKQGEFFDALLVEFGGSIKEPLSITKKNPLAVALFSKQPQSLSGIIKNNDGSFSIARVERFLEEELFSLDLVYKKLEREILSSYQDSIKTSLLDNLLFKLKPTINLSVLGL